MSCVPSHMCNARFLKTILAPSNWHGYLNFALGQTTLMYATIIFANMYASDSSRSSLWTPRTRLLTHSLNPWHKMTFNVIVASCVASDLHKQPKWGSVMYWSTSVLILGAYLESNFARHFLAGYILYYTVMS
jgi:hypothetical protein